jgi:protocatechuate 3,4-dioxygenase, alpha subunit
MSELTPYQTVGPFFHDGLACPEGATLATELTVGTRIRIEGTVLDGEGAPVSDAVIEIWQANAAGRYLHPSDRRELPLDPAFDGFGRAPTDDDGRFTFMTVKPGPVPGPDGSMQAPHLAVSVFARGVLTRIVTRLYFEDEASNGTDPILALVPPSRRGTLIAKRTADGVYRFDIVLQGQGETVFFDV